MRTVKVNMTGVESYNRCPEGEWLAKLKKIEEGAVRGSGEDCLKAQFEVIKGAAQGCTVFETFALGEKALWKLKSFLDAAGMKSNGKLTLDLDKMEGKTVIIDVVHDEYNDQKRAKISAYLKQSESTDDDEDDEDEDFDDDEDEEEEELPKKSAPKAKKPAAKPAKTKAASKSKKPEPEEDDDEDDEDDWEEDDD